MSSTWPPSPSLLSVAPLVRVAFASPDPRLAARLAPMLAAMPPGASLDNSPTMLALGSKWSEHGIGRSGGGGGVGITRAPLKGPSSASATAAFYGLPAMAPGSGSAEGEAMAPLSTSLVAGAAAEGCTLEASVPLPPPLLPPPLPLSAAAAAAAAGDGGCSVWVIEVSRLFYRQRPDPNAPTGGSWSRGQHILASCELDPGGADRDGGNGGCSWLRACALPAGQPLARGGSAVFFTRTSGPDVRVVPAVARPAEPIEIGPGTRASEALRVWVNRQTRASKQSPSGLVHS